jgi:signal peptidase I
MAERHERPKEPAKDHRGTDAGRAGLPPAGQEETGWNPIPGLRETIESIVVAFTLALLFRGFEAEAFVIPTGSMAPTLMGRHKDLACDACGRDFRVGSSAEEDDQSQSLRTRLSELERERAGLRRAVESDAGLPREREAARRRLELLESDRGPLAELQARLAGKMVPAARCPNCGNVMRLVKAVGQTMEYDARYPSFSGDRILVDKFAYDFKDPERWDVVVFRYPEDAKTNYIKRLVGLPGETVAIVRGDIWVSRDGQPPVIARKPPTRLKAMLQCVHDSRNVSRELLGAGWPLCWADWSAADAAGTGRWQTADDGRSWTVSSPAGETATLRYRHLLPTGEDWDLLRAGESLAERVRPTVIDDFQPYNAIPTRPHPVGDLAVEFVLDSRGAGGTVAVDLVERGSDHRCVFDLATGAVTLEAADLPGEPPRAATRVRGRGSWRILFANVDDELALFVNGRPVTFDRPAAWTAAMLPGDAPAREFVLEPVAPGDRKVSDLSPAGVEASGADVTVRGLRVLRDIYYIGAVDVGARPGEIFEEDVLEFPLAAGQFFVLGDNSAASKDSRLWLEGHHVDRPLLIGRAMVIFWPHAIPASWSVPIRIFGMEVRLPCWPNFGRMGFVR